MNLSLASQNGLPYFKLPVGQSIGIKKSVIRKIMRIGFLSTMLFFTVSLQLLFGSPVKSQTIDDVNIRMGLNNETLIQAFHKIEAQTSFRFMYRKDEVQSVRNLEVKSGNRTVGQLLRTILSGTSLTYRQVNNQVLIMSLGNNSSPFSVDLIDVPQIPYYIPRANIVKGHVTNSQGDPLVGVSVIVKGALTGTSTDGSGNYSIDVPADGTLVFSYVGFSGKEVLVGGRSSIDVILEESISALDQVVVVGYGEQRRTEVTSAVASVKSEDFIQGNVGDATRLIQGKVAGLTIVAPTGDPTKNSQIILRGTGTLATSTEPLILIDGIPGDFNTLDQDDIGSIDVLKDGSAAAIYGTRGSNGVILITTKRNKGQIQPTLSYNSYVSTEKFVKIPDMLSAREYRARIAAGAGFSDLGSNTDWIKEISNRFPVTHHHHLSVQGGNNKTNYIASFNYRQASGIITNYDYNTIDSRVDINHQMFDNKLKINFNVIGRRNKRSVDFDQVGQGLADSPPSSIFNSALWRNPTAPIKNEDGTWNEEPSISYYENPLALLNETYGGFKSYMTRVSGSATWEPVKDLSVKGLYSIQSYDDQRSQGQTKQHLSTVRDGREGYASKSAASSETRLLELTSNYGLNLNSHGIKALVGYSYQDRITEEQFMRNWGFPAGNFSYPDNIGVGQRAGLGGPNLMSSNKYASNLISFFSRINYNFSERYLLMASVRYEGSSKFVGSDKPWGTFPAISAGWRISKEDFLEKLTFIDELKLRVGYGITGTAPDQYFLGLPMLGFGGSFLINGAWVPSLGPTRNPNPALRWEEKKEINIGLDFEILKNRISGSIDYYERTTDGLLYNYSVPTPPNVYQTTIANVGIMKNKGLEFLINAIPISREKFIWNSTVSFSTNSNTLVSISNDLYKTTNPWFNAGSTGSPIQTYTHRVEVGKEIGNFYGYKVIDITEDGKWVYEDRNGETSLTRTEEDKKIIGNGLPGYYAGWNNNFRFGNFDLSVTMRGAFDFQILNYQRMFYENPGRTLYNQLSSSNDAIFGKVPLSSTVPLEYNSYYVEDGDYWKIDNIKLGYNVNVSNSIHMQKVYLYFSVLNTSILTKYKGMDPEVNGLGLTPGNDERFKYPSARIYSIGMNLTFK